MIMNPIKCENCYRELRPQNIGVRFEGDKLFRICLFCGDEFLVEYEE